MATMTTVGSMLRRGLYRMYSQPAIAAGGRAGGPSPASVFRRPWFVGAPHHVEGALKLTGVRAMSVYGTVQHEAVDKILTNNPKEATHGDRHILSVLVDDEAGNLSRISGLLAARSFNINSLTVSTAGIPGISRMTIVLEGNLVQMEQAVKQLEDLVIVWAVVVAGKGTITREMALVKVSTVPPNSAYSPLGEEGDLDTDGHTEGQTQAPCDLDRLTPHYKALMEAHPHREAVTALASLFGAEVVDVGSNQIILELSSWTRRIDAFIRAIRPFGIIEIARSGAIAMRRSEVHDAAEMDQSYLPRIPLQRSQTADLPPS